MELCAFLRQVHTFRCAILNYINLHSSVHLETKVRNLLSAGVGSGVSR